MRRNQGQDTTSSSTREELVEKQRDKLAQILKCLLKLEPGLAKYRKQQEHPFSPGEAYLVWDLEGMKEALAMKQQMENYEKYANSPRVVEENTNA